MSQEAHDTAENGEWRRGWKILLWTTGSIAAGSGLLTITASYFVKPLEEATGWGRAEIALGTTLGQFAMAITLPIIGSMADRIGIRPVAIIGMIAYGLLCVLMSVLPLSLPVYYSMLVLIAIAASGVSTSVMSRLVAERFERWRGTVLGIAISGPAILLMPLAPLMIWLVNEVSWRTGYMMLGGIALLLGLPCAVLATRIRNRASASAGLKDAVDQKGAAGKSLAQAVRTLEYWLMIAGGMLATLPLGGFLNQLSALLSDKGFSVGAVGWLATVYVTTIFIGRAGVGLLLDVIPPRLTVASVMGGAGCGALVLLSTDPSIALFSLAVGAIGLAMGGIASVKGFLIARTFGMKAYSAIFGTFSTIIVLGLGLGALFFGWIYDEYRDYEIALFLSAGAFIASGILYGYVAGGRPLVRKAALPAEAN